MVMHHRNGRFGKPAISALQVRILEDFRCLRTFAELILWTSVRRFRLSEGSKESAIIWRNGAEIRTTKPLVQLFIFNPAVITSTRQQVAWF